MKQRDDKNCNKSRREFIRFSGKILALGALSHFSLIGRADGKQPNGSRKICNSLQTNSCQYPDTYICSINDKHSCVNRFQCDPDKNYSCSGSNVGFTAE